MTTPLAVENVTKHYRQGDRNVAALNGVSLDVRQGQFLAIMGASGSGKSTLLYLMAALAAPDGGRVLVNGQEDRKSTRLNSSHSQISYAVFCLKKKKKAHRQRPEISVGGPKHSE